MNNFSRILILSLFGVFFLGSCMTSKKIVYINDMTPDSSYQSKEMPPLRIQKNDRLSITVNSKNPELVMPFNMGTGAYSVGENGEVNTSSSPGGAVQNYLVDQHGQITFPLLGNQHVVGMTIDNIKEMIQDKLISEKIVNDPIVKVELLNVKISVMGAVKSETVINVPDGRITLLEAITKAGGLNANAAADRVTVIREENGKRIRMINNVESKVLFDSPAYYLQQNDIVYVEPKTPDRTPKEERNWRLLSTLMGSVTIILSVISIVK